MDSLKQSGIASIGTVLIIIGFLVIAGGIYYSISQKSLQTISQKSPQPEQSILPTQSPFSGEQPQTSLSEVANWKTYRNEKYGFEITYPSQCVVAEQRGAWPYLDIVNFQKCGILIGIANRDYWKGTGPTNETRSYWDLGQDIRIGSNIWRKILWKDEFGQGFLRYVIQGNYDYSMDCGMASKEENIEEIVKQNMPYLNQMLSTFKFIR
jgi:hypothetical protein